MKATENNIDLVIFDLDGTLIHSAPDIVSTVQELLRRRGRPRLEDQVIVDAIGEGLMQLVLDCFPESRGNDRELAEISKSFELVYEEHLLNETEVFPGVFDFLDTYLKTPGHHVAIVTNKRISWTHRTLKGLGLDAVPWVQVYGADSLSERKPHPLPLLEVMRSAGVSRERTVMVGDGFPDMGAAARAGVHAVGCPYGYCNAEKLTKAGASLLIQSPHDLAQALKEAALLAPRIPVA